MMGCTTPALVGVIVGFSLGAFATIGAFAHTRPDEARAMVAETSDEDPREEQ